MGFGVSLGGRLKIENVGLMLTSVFYVIVGVMLFVAFAVANYPPHVAILGILSLVTAYGLFLKRMWGLYAVFAVWLISTVFGLYMLFYLFGINLILEVGMIVYLALTWIATLYVAARRKKLNA